MQPSFLFENQYLNLKVAGVDEAGRGPLAGPVVACCASLNFNQEIINLKVNDSKKLNANKRKQLFEILIKKIDFGIGIVDHQVIDQVNIYQATKLAMIKAYENFLQKYSYQLQVLLVDGNFTPFLSNDMFDNNKINDSIIDSKAIVKGDQKSYSIACASIIAKETRDQLMLEYHQQFPQYNFAKNMGYGTKIHLEKIKQFGACPIHRKSFEPIKSLLIVNG